MHHRLRLLATVLCAWAGDPAFADENAGLYLGAGLGDFSSEIDELGDVDLDFDEDSDATKLFGGWRFNRFIAAQLDLIDFGESDAALELLEIESEARGLAPSVVGTLPVGPLELFARAGIVFYTLEVSLDGDELLDDSSQDVLYGAGIGLTLLERLALRAEYERIEIDELEDAEAVWITAAWRF